MNKLIIVGNGFDLHNGIRSSYNDFVKWQIGRLIENQRSGGSVDSKLMSVSVNSTGLAKNYKDCDSIENIVEEIYRPELFRGGEAHPRPIVYQKEQYNFRVKPKSELYQKIFSKYGEANWVDIEIEYFNLLVEILHQAKNNRHEERNAYERLNRLNDDLQETIDNLKMYLAEESANKNPKDYLGDVASQEIDVNTFIEEKLYKDLPDGEFSDGSRRYLKPRSIMFLNFNYTGLASKLRSRHNNFLHLNIHGSAHLRDNDLVFGYGDEVGEEYREIEKTNHNEFLRFVKSFAYSQNSRYSELLRFINSDHYVVYIWGHSCALSDRTLLNMLFEHHHCAAIKPFYWRRPNSTDNYTEIIQNISRHFDEKQKFRERLVNKEDCRAL